MTGRQGALGSPPLVSASVSLWLDASSQSYGVFHELFWKCVSVFPMEMLMTRPGSLSGETRENSDLRSKQHCSSIWWWDGFNIRDCVNHSPISFFSLASRVLQASVGFSSSEPTWLPCVLSVLTHLHFHRTFLSQFSIYLLFHLYLKKSLYILPETRLGINNQL